MTHKEYADGLRMVADWYEAHTEIALPGLRLSNYQVYTKEEAANVMRALGSCNKEYSTELFSITKEFGAVTAAFVFNRDEVCIRKVVGQKTIPEKVIEAHTIPATTEDIVEWECSPILAEEKAAA